MILFTASAVILYSSRAEQAYSSAREFAIGTAVAGAVAVALNLAVLPSLHADFLSLAIVLSLTFIPLGMLAAGSWHPLVFSAIATQLGPILSIQNEPSYAAAVTFNDALAIFGGTLLAALSLRLLPPLSPARRIQRLLSLTLRDVRMLALAYRGLTPAAWLGRISRRLEVLPPQANLEQEAELLAALSVGEAVIALRSSVSHDGTLARALAELGEGSPIAAHEMLLRFSDQQSQQTEAEAPGPTGSAVQATLIADALQRHTDFFRGNSGASVTACKR